MRDEDKSYAQRLAEAMGFDRPEDVTPAKVSELADKVGISYTAVFKHLHGTSKSMSALNNSVAAAFLKVDSDWLAVGRARSGLSRWALKLAGELDHRYPEPERESMMDRCIGVMQFDRLERDGGLPDPVPTPPPPPAPKTPRARRR